MWCEAHREVEPIIDRNGHEWCPRCLESWTKAADRRVGSVEVHHIRRRRKQRRKDDER